MRQIKTINIKKDAFPIISKKTTVRSSKKDFMRQLETFLAKDDPSKKKTRDSKKASMSKTDKEDKIAVKEASRNKDKINKEKREATQEDESENIFDGLHHIQLFDYVPMKEKTPHAVVEEVVDEINRIDFSNAVTDTKIHHIFDTIELDEQEILLLDTFVAENIEVFAEMNSLPASELEVYLADFREQFAEVLINIEESEIEGRPIPTEMRALTDQETIELIHQLRSEFTEFISTASENRKLNHASADFSSNDQDANITPFPAGDESLTTAETISNQGMDESSQPKEVNALEKQSEGKQIEISSIESESSLEEIAESEDNMHFDSENIYDPTKLVSTTDGSKPIIETVTQDDFIPKVETLIIEETQATETSEQVTTARIQLTPDHLGKVDLQIEINGKELTAKLIVEQKETKEWIDQQVAQLKEKLLTQEITVKDFEVLVQEENLNDTFMSSEDNPFFKQKEKESQARKEQQTIKKQSTDNPIQREEQQYSTRDGISILV